MLRGRMDNSVTVLLSLNSIGLLCRIFFESVLLPGILQRQTQSRLSDTVFFVLVLINYSESNWYLYIT